MNLKEFFGTFGCGVLAGVVIAAGIFVEIGKARGVDDTRSQAIRDGLGRYVVDPQSGTVYFQWGSDQ